MSSPNQCTLCDRAIDPYGQDTRCERCCERCQVCGKDPMLCQHPLRNGDLDLTSHDVSGHLRRVA